MADPPVNVLEIVLAEVAQLLSPILVATQGERERELLFAALGWDLDAITGLPVNEIDDALHDLDRLIKVLANGVDAADFGAILDALQGAGEAIGTVEQIETALRHGLPAIPVGALAVDLLNFIVLRYLHQRFPRIYALLEVITLIDAPALVQPPVTDPATGMVVYDGWRRPALRLDRLPRMFTDPGKLFKDVYWPEGFDTQAHADAAADRMFPRIARLVTAFGGEATYGVNPGTGLSFGSVGTPLVSHMLTLRQPLPSILAADGALIRESVSLTAGLLAADSFDESLGVVLVPSADAEFIGVGASWLVDVAVHATPGAFVITKAGVFPDTSAAEVDAALTVMKLPGPTGAAVLIGSKDGTHFSIGTIVLSTAAEIKPSGFVPELGFDLRDAELVIKAGDGDGFLKSVLPPDGMRMPLRFGMTWSPRTGVVFHGGATLEVDLPIDLDLTFLKIPSIHLSLGAGIEPQHDPKVTLGVAATVELEIGPVYASVEQMGIAFVFTFPEKGGNLGPLDLTLGFKPPKGLSLSVDAGPVSGGGYLFADYDKGEYAGVLHLEIAGKISITAIGLLNTRFPDGSEGFSLVVIISAEFPPIQLGYGFFLGGIGGLVGINRSMNVPALQDGIRRGAIGSLLFPVDPIPHARQIVADVGAIFPATRDQFVVGPMIKLGWGQGLLTATIAVIIQFPALKIALLGRVQLEVPPIDEAAIVVLRLDFGGIVDVPAKTISFDGSLDGSRVAAFTISGDIALRAGWGDQPNFAMSGGGWYPGYEVPPGFPPLKRLAIALASSDNPRLRLEAYFALTPATLQMGGHAEVYYGVDIAVIGLIEVDAGVGFDAIINFPADFAAHFNIHVLLRRNHAPFIGVELDVRLTGAEPIVIDGKASLHFLGTHEIPFHKQLGGEPQSVVLDPVHLLDLVLAALADPRSWSAELPAGATGVRLREDPDPGAAGKPLGVHPLGTLAVHQTVAPLDVALQKVGDAPISGPANLQLAAVRVGDQTYAKGDLPIVKEHFAVSQFFVLSEHERVTQPPFERMHAGVQVPGGGISCTGVRGVTLSYEDLEIPADPEAVLITLGVTELSPMLVQLAIDAGPAATKGAAASAAQRFAAAPAGVRVAREQRWALVDPHAATAAGKLAGVETYATAAEARAAAHGRHVVVTRAGEAA